MSVMSICKHTRSQGHRIQKLETFALGSSIEDIFFEGGTPKCRKCPGEKMKTLQTNTREYKYARNTSTQVLLKIQQLHRQSRCKQSQNRTFRGTGDRVLEDKARRMFTGFLAGGKGQGQGVGGTRGTRNTHYGSQHWHPTLTPNTRTATSFSRSPSWIQVNMQIHTLLGPYLHERS